MVFLVPEASRHGPSQLVRIGKFHRQVFPLGRSADAGIQSGVECAHGGERLTDAADFDGTFLREVALACVFAATPALAMMARS